MPELPEVESARKHISDLCVGHIIVRVELKEQGGGPRDGLVDDIILTVPEAQDLPRTSTSNAKGISPLEKPYMDAFLSKQLAGVHRKGKQLWFTFSEPDSVAVLLHFGMTGSCLLRDHIIPSYKSFKIKPGEKQEWPPRFTKLELEFDNGVHVAFCDPRRLGRMKLRKDPLNSEPLINLGIDPHHGPLPSAQELRSKLQRCSVAIKALLLDQERVFCGIGNYLADEILYQSGIHPETMSNRINDIGLSRLLDSMRSIITTAVSVDARYEDFPTDWLFHYRWGKGKKGESPTMPDGSRITFETCGGRTSAIVAKKQPRQGDYILVGNATVEEVQASLDSPTPKKVKKNSDSKRKKTTKEVKVETDFTAMEVNDSVEVVKVKEEKTVGRKRGRKSDANGDAKEVNNSAEENNAIPLKKGRKKVKVEPEPTLQPEAASSSKATAGRRSTKRKIKSEH